MSSALAIASVTAVLRDLLNNGLIDHDISGAVGGNVTVSALPPDRVFPSGTDETTQLNLFMHQVAPNTGWRNTALPSRNAAGDRLTNPPLALDLHYLLTAYGRDDLHAEILLGYAMQLLHETPVLDRAAIRRALDPSPVDGTVLPPALQALAASDLADQVEQIKITLSTLNSEEMSKLWAAFQTGYRPTAAYHISVVLIEASEPTRSPLPVLTRGPADQGVLAQASLQPPFPTLASVGYPGQQISANLGDELILGGHHLDGINIAIRFRSPRLPDPIDRAPLAGNTHARIVVQIPNLPAAWPAGLWTVEALVERPGEGHRRVSNQLSIAVAPAMTLPPNSVVRDGGTDRVTIELVCSPEVLPPQDVSLAVGGFEAPAEPHISQTDTLTFVFDELPAGTFTARLRVDGVDSHFIDRSVSPPVFDPIQEVTIPA